MKRFFYILFISSTIIFSFGFRGCDSFFCALVGELNYISYGFRHAGLDDQQIVGEDGQLYFCPVDHLSCACGQIILSQYDLKYVSSMESSGLNKNESGNNVTIIVGDTGTVFYSSDNGATWEDRSIPGLTKNLSGFDFLDYGSGDLQVVVCGENGNVYKSTNSGGGWSWQQSNTITTENLNSIGSIGQTIFIAVGEKGTIIRTTDGGQTWQNKTIGDTSAHFNRIFLKPSFLYYNRGWIVADNGKIYATTNYGDNWFPQNSGVTTNLYDVIFRNENEGAIVGASGVVRHTTDGGGSWLEDTYFNGLTDGDIISITGIDPNTASALIRGGTENPGGTTILTVSSEPLDVKGIDNQIPSVYKLEQNYPNPFNPGTTIQFSIPEETFVKLEIFNSLGEKITSLVSEELNAGNYKYEWNAENLPGGKAGLSSGIYYYKLTANEFSETKKLILLK